MDREEFEVMEVKPKEKDFYFVTMFQYEKEKPEYPDYIKDWIEFDGENWDYGEYKCYVCFIHKRDT